MKNNLFSAMVVIVAIMVVASGCIEESYSRNALTAGGGGGGGTTIINNTYYGTMNQTPNMTPGTPGAPGSPGTAATINVNYTFTGSSGTSALVSNIGTVNAAIFDFTIPQGVNGTPGIPGPAGPTGPMNQTINLTANMTAGPPGGTGGQVLFFNNTAGGLVAGYEGLYPIPSGASEIDESVTVNSGTGQVIIDPYITAPGYPGMTVIPAGLWRFRTFHYVDGASGTTTAVFKVYNRTTGGTETLQFTATSDDINALAVTEYLTSYVQTANINMPSTDTIVVKVYGQTTHPANIVLHFVYQGATHTSHVQTPLETLSSQYRTIAQDDIQDESINTTMRNNVSMNFPTFTNLISAQASTLKSADDHIASNSSGGISYSTLSEADQHIALNKSQILSADIPNDTAQHADTLKVADQHIALNTSQILSAVNTNESVLQSIANDSKWDLGYTIPVQFLTGTWANSTTYYFGNIPADVTSTANARRIYIVKGGNITGAEIWVASGTAGSDQGWQMDIVKNGATNGNTTTIGNVSTALSPLYRRWSNTSGTMRIKVDRGDYIEIKTQINLFPVKPATSIGGGYLYVDS